ncbi:MAG: hypothetical protein DDT42_00710 [candidate division WS2 bacterium]|uniref:AEC family transporter n=1 Tax=Psychracetigena formicireducens TaxID=2986056 RepID=A0A9E2F0X1_PSYF1|nr:hypothetical protein [Candidatus Psychracetigena formicireducens]MBT9144854.1 hypothetical protein [Candidatus Psychracetigena formicireducens]
MIDKIVTLLVLIALGFFCKKIKLISDEGSLILKSIVFNITLPALVFMSIRGASWTPEYLKIPLVVWLSVIFLGIIIYFFSRLLRFNKELTAILVLTGVMGNTTFLGYPIVKTLLGAESLPYGIVYDQSSFLFLFLLWLPFTAYIFLNSDGVSKKVNYSVLDTLIKNPPLIAIIVAIILRNIFLPAFVIDSLNIIAQSTTLLVMLFVGTMLNLDIKKEEIMFVGLILLFKQLCFPAVNYLFSIFLGVSNQITQAILVQASMPVMIVSIIYGGQIGLNASLISKIVTISTVLSPIFLVIISYFI